MVYLPRVFTEDRPPVLDRFIAEHAFATLVTSRADGVAVSHVPLLWDADGPVSSTRIRGFLGAGRVADAARLLGRWYRVEAQVGKGLGLGKELGFPTANLELLEHRLMPADGMLVLVLQGLHYEAGATNPGRADRI